MWVPFITIMVATLFVSLVFGAEHKKDLARREQYLRLGKAIYQKPYLEKVREFACEQYFGKIGPYPRLVLSGEKYAIHGPYLEYPLVPNGQIWTAGMTFSELLVINTKCYVVGGKRLKTKVFDTGSVYSQVVGQVTAPTLRDKLFGSKNYV